MTEEDKAFFIYWCIEEYAAEKNLSTTNVSELFTKHKIFSYLEENAEILHTQGKSYILNAIDDYKINTFCK